MIKKWFIYSLVFCLLTGISRAEDPIYYRDNHIENNAYSARALALGRGLSAVPNGIDGLLANPGSMINLREAAFDIKSERTLVDVDRVSFVSVMPINNKNVIALGYTSLDVGKIYIAEDLGGSIAVVDTATYQEKGYMLGYCYLIDDFSSIGVTLKYYENTFDLSRLVATENITAIGGDIDIGMLFRMDNDLNISLGIRNLASMTSPTGVLVWSNEYKESYDFGGYIGFSKILEGSDIMLLGEYRGSKLYHDVIAAGIEFKISKYLDLRFGYNSLDDISAGLGLNLWGGRIDYAYVPNFATADDNRHFVSLGYRFNIFTQEEPEEVEDQGVFKRIQENDPYFYFD